MALHFDDSSGFYVDEVNDVRTQVEQVFLDAFSEQGTINTSAESPAGQLIDSITAMVMQKDSEILHVANMFNPETATGIWQDALARIYYIERKNAEATVVTCQCRGLYGTVIPAGAIVQDNTSGYRYVSSEANTIPSTGVLDIDFVCTEKGAITCNANTVTKIITVVSGWDSVNNSAAGVVGNVTESQSAFEQRRFETVANNAHGTAYSLEGALLTLDEVQDCVVLDNRTAVAVTKNGVSVAAHSVAVCLAYDTGTDTTNIAKTIYEKLDAGCGTTGDGTNTVSYTIDGITHTYNVVKATPTPMYIAVTINRTSSTPASVATLIKEAILADFSGNSGSAKVGLAQTLYASRFAVPVIKNAGVSDLVSITIGWSASPSSSYLTINANVYPTLTAANITITENT